MDNDRITSRIKDFSKRTGIGRTKLFELIHDGRIKAVKIDGLTLVIEDSYRRLIEQSRISNNVVN